MRRSFASFVALTFLGAAVAVRAQSATTTRLLLLQADDRRTPTTADLNLIRISARSGNIDTARVALRMLGRLERPALIADILPGLRHSLPEVRIEAANATAQAAQGARTAVPTRGLPPPNPVGAAETALIARLGVEADPAVRGAICEALARLPFTTAADAIRAESAIVGLGHATVLPERLGLAKALEAFVRLQAPLRPPSADVLALLVQLARADTVAPGLDLLRDARVRRLAVEALTTANAIDEAAIVRAAEDADAQVRRLGMKAIGVSGRAVHKVQDGLVDPSPMVRIEALRALRTRGGDAICALAVRASADVDLNAALVAIDQLAACATSAESIALLSRVAADTGDLGVVRGWHRQAHALVALADAAPDQARALLANYQSATIWQVRAYAARAAAQLKDAELLGALSRDTDDRVANVALAALGQPIRGRAAAKTSAVPAVTAAEVRRLAAPRARIVVRDVGTIDLALFTGEAPGTVIRFVRLADGGYYNGLSFDRIALNAVAQSGSRGSEAAEFPSRETSTWPHVRGSVGVTLSDSNDAQFFINLVDNPRFDHQLTVFAQVLNGADVVDRLLEGDVIESITVLP